ncbi:MAG: 30S ribosomal protein S4 [Parcubacteria group bacterium]|nr:30S ribosomal protein S4 [Parcubacteria group bacterium]
MARYTGPKEKIERRLGEKLFLKGERSYSQKTATMRKPYPPGMHGKKTKNRKFSEYGLQLISKQKVRSVYRILERQFRKYINEALKSKGDSGEVLVQNLERRLDNVIFRMGFSDARDTARQLVTHSHFLVNDKPINIPSFRVKAGDTVKIKSQNLKNKYFSSVLPRFFKKYQPPSWLDVDKDGFTGKVKNLPNFPESGVNHKDIQAIIEFYSR